MRVHPTFSHAEHRLSATNIRRKSSDKSCYGNLLTSFTASQFRGYKPQTASLSKLFIRLDGWFRILIVNPNKILDITRLHVNYVVKSQ